MKKIKYLLSILCVILLMFVGFGFKVDNIAYAAGEEQIEIQYLASEVLDGQKYQYNDDGVWRDVVMPDGSYPTSAMDMISAFRNCLGSTIAYFNSSYPNLAQIRVVKNGSDYLYDFVGWSAITESGEYVIVDSSVTLNENNITEANREAGVQTLYATFEHKKFNLTVSETYSGWALDNNGNTISFISNGDGTKTARIPSDSVLNFIRSDESVTSEYWSVENVDLSQEIILEEQSSSMGGNYWLNYSFIMPQNDVEAIYDTTVRLDTAKGDYYFGTYTINDHQSYGIKIVNGGNEEYIRWPMVSNATTAYFTSSVPTSNQIYLDAKTYLYLDGVELTERDSIVSDLNKLYSSGIYKSSLTTYTSNHNILVENNPQNPQPYNSTRELFNVYIYLLNDSTIFSIGQRCFNNHVMHTQAAFYSNTISVDLRQHSLEMYAFTAVSQTSSTLKNGTVNVLTSSNETYDKKIHSVHVNGNSFSLSSLTFNGANRSIFMRHGGNETTGGGNGVTFSITASTLKEIDKIHFPFLKTASKTVIEANELRTISYGYYFSSATITANIIAFVYTVHTNYANSDSYIENSTVTVNDWMSVDRLRVRSNSTLTIKNGLYLYESLTVNKSTMTVGSINRFRTINGNTVQDNKHYSGTLSQHYFYVDILNGAKVTVTGNGVEEGKNAVDIGIVHNSIPQIKIYNSTTSVEIFGSVSLQNNLQLYGGASFIVHGELVLGQGLSVSGSGTVLDVEGNLYHINNNASDIYVSKTTDGVIENVYWTFEIDQNASVTIDGNVGSYGDNDRINVLFSDGENIIINGDIVRDIQVMYSLPDGYENVAANPTNIRLINNVYIESVVSLVKPELVGESLIELEDNCWFWNGQLITGWNENGTKGTIKNFETIHIIRLVASASNYSLLIIYDTSAIQSLEYLINGSEEWSSVEIPSSGGSISIPMDAQVKVVVIDSYIGMVCAESILNGTYNTISMNVSDSTYTFTMSQMQILLYIQKELTLYLDEGDIYILDGGFARYSETNGLMQYTGNIIVSHKNPSEKCDNTLYINRNVLENEQKVTIKGLNIKDLDGTESDTVSLKDGVTVNLYLSGANNIRNIVVPKNSEIFVRGIDDAKIKFANSNYFSGQTDDGAQYRSIIGAASAGKINLIGGDYTWKFSIKDQGTGTAIGGPSSCMGIYLKGITFKNYSSTIHANAFSASSYNITVEDSYIEFLAHTTIFKASTMVVTGNSQIITSFPSSNYSSTFVGVTSSVTISGTSVVQERGLAKDLILSKSGLILTICDNATYDTAANIILKKFVVKDNAVVIVKELNDDSQGRVIFAQTVDISGGTITAGHLIASGYIASENQIGDLINSYKNNSGIATNGSISISGGSVNLIGGKVVVGSDLSTQTFKGIIGGAKGVSITISGGTVNADTIGSCEYVFATYRTYYSIVSDTSLVGATVNISGQTTNLINYSVLGGKKSNLTISSASIDITENVKITSAIISLIDATVTMSTNARLGGDCSVVTISGNSSIDGKDSGYGEIYVPNGSVTISGTSSVHVSKIYAKDGTVNISTTSRSIQGYDYDNNVNAELVGVFVDCLGILPTDQDQIGTMNGDVIAKDITIFNSAYVCAYRIGSYNEIGSNNGSFIVNDSSYLFANIYGAFGDGVCLYTQSAGAITVGRRQLSIHYNFNVDSLDELIIPGNIVYTYIYDENNPTNHELITPHRYGYRFDGWFDSEGIEVTSISSGQIVTGEITAHWSLIDMWFYISIGYEDENGNETITYVNLNYKQTSLTLPGAGKRYRYYFIGYLAGEEWWPCLTSGLMQGTITLPNNLYDYYLSVNGIIWSDGLSNQEVEMLDLLESIKTNQDVIENISIIKFITFTGQWQTTRVDIIFDAGNIYVTTFRYNGRLKKLDEQGTGIQKISMYKEEAYSVNAWCTGFIPEAVRLGYRFEYWVSEDGLFKLYTTDADMIVNENYMVLYAVYSPLVSNNDSQVKLDKHYTLFDDGLETVNVFANSSLSFVVNLNSSFDDGLNKQLQFAFTKLFINTKLTLVIESNSVKTYYYYIVKETSSKIVNLNDFVKMGYKEIGAEISFIDLIEQDLLLIVDYSNAENVTSGNIIFDMLVSDGNNAGDLNGTTIEYTIIDSPEIKVESTGEIVANVISGVVSIDKEADYHYNDKDLILVAEFDSDNKNFNVNAILVCGENEIQGEWISYRCIVFNLGLYADFSADVVEFRYNISTLNLGQNILRWKVAYSNGNSNVLNSFLKSSESSIEYVNDIRTSMKVEQVKIDDILDDRVVLVGSHRIEISLGFEGNLKLENVNISLEKQTSYGIYENVEAVIQKDGKVAIISINQNCGVGLYRIKFSYNENSNEENVYYTFIIR